MVVVKMKLINKLYNEIKDLQDCLFYNKFGFNDKNDSNDILIKLNNMNDIVEDLENELYDIKDIFKKL